MPGYSRMKMLKEFARKRKNPKATINPPKRSYPGKPTRLPRYDRMKGM